ncbi:MAG: aminoacetone oxidase family FAD-binding enzyme [Sneathiella sp.]|uniref:TIGR03862 family flavoprotein n=1 Tax=Sneathiella sp. TaxID=1964365 RepID=UPI000C49FEE5|nr:TIGR03862 family flavoprotein [Sneathiella sp.]MAL78788.1 aminoacetone oxidase family FAD-binding enzyme [Sneathiella sp.]
MTDRRKTVAIVGAGPAGLMAAETLSTHAGLAVHVFDHKPSVARKFLIAGRGGLNLTHSENIAGFAEKYAENSARFATYLKRFSPDDMIGWATSLGIETFKGSSGRVFPVGLKATPLLRAWLRLLDQRQVQFHLRHSWIGTTDTNRLIFRTDGNSQSEFAADAILYAMGGGSYAHLGSDAAWISPLAARGLDIAPLAPSNCGFTVGWSDFFLGKFEGSPLKNIAISFDRRSIPGDLVVTRAGLEGGAIYALSKPLREALATAAPVAVTLDLKPAASADDIIGQLSRPRGKMSRANFLRKMLNLSPLHIALLHEFADKSDFDDANRLGRLIKALPVPLTGMQGIARAISSAGGVKFANLTDDLMIRGTAGHFVAGEMLNWEAPTGGYLLQGCFATGAVAADGIAQYLGIR